MADRTLLYDNWEFLLLPVESASEALPAPGAPWKAVDLPHDWLIERVNDLYADGIGWYRRPLSAAELNARGAEGCRTFLRFDGVYMDCAVFVNGRRVFEWKYGYTAFEFEITDALRQGAGGGFDDAEILVRVTHRAPNSRWYSGAGIYRDAWLIRRPDAHIAGDGVYIAPRRLEGNAWKISVSAEIDGGRAVPGETARSGGMGVRFVVLDGEGGETCRANAARDAEGGTYRAVLETDSPRLWDIASPERYTLVTELLDGEGTVIDREKTRFGFREIAFHPTAGFSLNGRRVKLRGVCQHHDLGCLGAAVNAAALRRQFAILRGMGVNAIRTAHNPPAEAFMEIADETGMLVLSEAFDMWEKPKNPFDYARFFPEWAERDVASWIRRDRNRPSVIMWSVGNEIHDTHAGERGQEITRRLMAMVAAHDGLGNAPVTIGSNYMPWENAQKCADIVKLAGYNYAEKHYESHHRSHPDWIIYGSETASIAHSRGIYHFPASRSTLADDDEQCSSLGNSATSWGAKSIDACIADDRDADFCLGQFLWSGFDYIGEPTPYFTKNSYFGQVDTAGFPKDSYYRFKAEWTDVGESPMVHVFPYWDFNPGQAIDVIVCSNADEVALYRDGTLVGRERIDHRAGRALAATWRLPWAPGTLEAVAYGEDGREVAREGVRSFGDARRIVVTVDRERLYADGVDLAFAEIAVVDADGVPVANANNRVRVRVTGAGRLVGLDNGDSADRDEYQGTSRRLFSGKLLAVIGAKTQPGDIALEATSPGLQSARVALRATESPHGILGAGRRENPESPENGEIPVRKIEIACESGTAFGPEARSKTVTARLRPDEATWRDVEWRVTDDAGIDSNLARIEPAADGSSATLTALGDGNFRVRATARNGSGKIRLISQLEFSASGLGPAYLDPYDFVSGGLWKRTNAELGNGNDRGVATPRDGTSYVCFDGIDFGPWGSDEITLPLFALDSEPFPVEIWDGMPDEEGSERLALETYDIPTKWNTYQSVTWKLARRMRGIGSVCIALRRKAHIKGFSFTRPDKARAKIGALENDAVYGDRFTPVPERNAIEGIGNNVSLEYRDMDFGEIGCSRLTIYGRTPLERNSINIRLDGSEGQRTQIVEFERAEAYTERSFTLEPIRGNQTVTFVFLPGCEFDLGWFRFE